MSNPIEENRQIFVDEGHELLGKMEATLLALEGDPAGADEESVNALFRAAHTIKGSAGVFGFSNIVAFTHVLESVMERVRSGKLPLDGPLLELALQSGDHLGTLVSLVGSTGTDQVDAAARDAGTALVERLERYLAGAEEVAPASVSSQCWHISLRFGKDVLRNGMDPLSFIRYLGSIGDVERVLTVRDRLPALADFDAESCYLGFEILLRSGADRKTIADVFEFVRDDCELKILPPRSRLADYAALIESMPGSRDRLGEILVACGALTPAELEAALAAQRQAPEPHPPLGQLLTETAALPPEVLDAALARQQKSRARAVEADLHLRVAAEKLDRLITLVGELVIAGSASSTLARARGDGPLQEATATVENLVGEIRDSALRLRMVQVGDTFNRFHRVVRDTARDLGKDIELVTSGGDTELDKSVVERIADPLMHLVRNAMDHGIEHASARVNAGKPGRGRISLHAYHDSGSVVLEVSDDGRGLDRARLLAKGRERGLVAEDETPGDEELLDLIFEPGFSTATEVTNLSGRGVGMDVVRRNITELRGTVTMKSEPGRGATVIIRLPLTLAIIDGFLVKVGPASYVVPLEMVFECIAVPPELQGQRRQGDYLPLRGQVLPLLRLREVFKVQGEPPRRESVVVLQNAGQRAGLVVDQLVGEQQTVIKPLGRLFSSVAGIGGSTVLGSGEVALILDVPGLLQRAVKHGGGRRSNGDGNASGKGPKDAIIG
jgi:two-component system chemotaxis sensor kinase CheA